MNFKILMLIASLYLIGSDYKEYIDDKNYELKEEFEDSLRDILDEYENR